MAVSVDQFIRSLVPLGEREREREERKEPPLREEISENTNKEGSNTYISKICEEWVKDLVELQFLCTNQGQHPL